MNTDTFKTCLLPVFAELAFENDWYYCAYINLKILGESA